jgi:hypothetical protein
MFFSKIKVSSLTVHNEKMENVNIFIYRFISIHQKLVKERLGSGPGSAFNLQPGSGAAITFWAVSGFAEKRTGYETLVKIVVNIFTAKENFTP